MALEQTNASIACRASGVVLDRFPSLQECDSQSAHQPYDAPHSATHAAVVACLVVTTSIVIVIAIY